MFLPLPIKFFRTSTVITHRVRFLFCTGLLGKGSCVHRDVSDYFRLLLHPLRESGLGEDYPPIVQVFLGLAADIVFPEFTAVGFHP